MLFLMTMRRGRTRVSVVSLATILAVAATLALSGIASASATGNYGPNFLRDNDEFGGARCVYPEPWTALDRISVRPPSVYAHDRTGQIDSQTVGWQVIVDSSLDKVTWGVASKSKISRATASETIDAPLTAKTVSFPAPPGSAYFRIRIRTFWYFPNRKTVDGRADRVVIHYEVIAENFGSAVRTEPCKGDTPLVGP